MKYSSFGMSMAKHFVTGLKSIYRSLYFPPTIIAVAILVATGITWRSSRLSLNHDIQTAVNSRAATTEQAIRSTMMSYQEILKGTVGLFQGSTDVTSSDWSNFLQAFNLGQDFRRAQAFGFARVVHNDQLDDYLAYMRDQGLPDYQISPADPPRDVYAPVTYVETVSPKPPRYGYDLYTDKARQPTMLQARDTGHTAITNRVLISPTGDPNVYNGFVMYQPYYDPGMPTNTPAERQAAIKGYTFAAFRGDIFFDGISATSDSKASAYRAAINTDKTDVYRSPHFEHVSKQANVIHVVRGLNMFGQTWNIEYVFDRKGLVSDVQLRRPVSVLVAGTFTATLISMVVFLLLRSRAQELLIQKEQAVDLAKDELLSLASHQLRTPATGVKQYVGMVLQGFSGKVPKEQRSLLEKAYASNDRQLRVINEILHLAKIDSGRIVLARQETDLNVLVEDIVGEQNPDIQAAQHRITLRLPKKPILLYADAHTLRMAIENVLSNAVKYTPEGGEIGIRLRKDAEYAYLRIKDNGVGIAAGDLDKLFKQFSRLPNEMSLRVGGTGVGLYLAKHLVELHGGRIDVKSTLHEGSVFTIVIPLVDSGKDEKL